MWDLYLGTGHFDLRRMGAGWPFPGAILLPRNVLERRCDPASRWRHPAISGRDQHLILICLKASNPALQRPPGSGPAWPMPLISMVASTPWPQPDSRRAGRLTKRS
jgi:hypothetical protein